MHIFAAQVRGVAGPGDAEGLAGHAGRRQCTARHRRRAIVGLGARQGQISLVDVGGQAGRLGDHVVAGIDTGQRIAGDGNCLANVGIGIGEGGRAAAERDAVAVDDTGGDTGAAGQRGRSGAIIGFAVGRQAGEVDGFGRDRGGLAVETADEVVVAVVADDGGAIAVDGGGGIGAHSENAGDVDGFVGADILVGKGGLRTGGIERQSARQRHCGSQP